jgi:hypothetical protein
MGALAVSGLVAALVAAQAALLTAQKEPERHHTCQQEYTVPPADKL